MAFRFAVLLVALLVAPAGLPRADAAQRAARSVAADVELGPEMQAYLGFIDTEEAELQHLFEEGEVPADDYKRSRDRLHATKAAALRVVGERGGDTVPDLYVLRASELTQVLSSGMAAIRGKRAGERIDEDWLYHGTIRRGDLFYVLERTTAIGRDTSY